MHVQVYKSKHIPTSQIVFLSKTFHMMHIKKKKKHQKRRKAETHFMFPSLHFPFTAARVIMAETCNQVVSGIKCPHIQNETVFFSFKKKVNKDLNLVDKQIPEQRSLNSFREKGLKIFA